MTPDPFQLNPTMAHALEVVSSIGLAVGVVAIASAAVAFTYGRVGRNSRGTEAALSGFPFLLTAGLILMAGSTLVSWVGHTRGAADTSGGHDPVTPSPEATGAATASPSPTQAPTPSAGATSADSVQIPWGTVGMIGLCVLGAVVAILLVMWLTRVGLDISARHRVQKLKALRMAKVPREHEAGWQRLHVKELELGKRYLSYEDDLEKTLRYPLMRDITDPAVMAAVEAMGRARDLWTSTMPDPDASPALTDYGQAVAAFETALEAAETKAHQARWNRWSAQERKKAERALAILSYALDESAYPQERRTAYQRVLKLMSELSLPAPTQRVMDAIETQVGHLELMPGGAA